MAIKIFYPNGSTEIIPQSIGADENFLNGTYDFFDEKGVLLKRIKIQEGITWQPEEEPALSTDERSKNIENS